MEYNNFTDEQLQQLHISASIGEFESYLKNTDWYYARKAETGEEVPADVVAKRIEAREFIRSQGV